MKIEQGVLNHFTLRPVGAGINSAQYAMVNIGGQNQRCVVKPVGEREIAAECFCALLGDALSLPTLTPVVVTHPVDGSLWFGSRDATYPSLSARLRLGPTADQSQLFALAAVLSTWSQVGHVISFDELVANGDRNPGNVLWNGSVFAIIDHEPCLGNKPKVSNRLALFATANFQASLVAGVGSSATASALAHQAVLSAGQAVWDMIQNEFQTIPPAVGQHHGTCEMLAKQHLVSLPHHAAHAMSPLLQGAAP
jgi:hypothetical protein